MRFSVSIDILSAQKGAKLLPTDTFPCLKCICGRGSPRSPSWIWGGEGEGREKEGEVERKGGKNKRGGKEGEGKGKGKEGVRVVPQTAGMDPPMQALHL